MECAKHPAASHIILLRSWALYCFLVELNTQTMLLQHMEDGYATLQRFNNIVWVGHWEVSHNDTAQRATTELVSFEIFPKLCKLAQNLDGHTWNCDCLYLARYWPQPPQPGISIINPTMRQLLDKVSY